MNKALPFLLVALLLPVATAQMVIGESAAPPRPIGTGPDTLMVFYNVEGHTGGQPFLVAGADNVVNFSAMNGQKKWWNSTITVNVTGATPSVTSFQFDAEPLTTTWKTFSLHPDGVGIVEVTLTSDTPSPTTGEPIHLGFSHAAVPPVSTRWVDPQPESPTLFEDGATYKRVGYGSVDREIAIARLPPGASLVPRVEVRNLGASAVPGYTMELRGELGRIGNVEVQPLEAGERRTIEFPTYTAQNERGMSYPGMVLSLPLTLSATYPIGSSSANVMPASFRLENGAAVDVKSAEARIEVRGGLGADILVPESLTLGVPTRLHYNVTNYATTEQTGTLVILLSTPGGLYYEVQGPESRVVPIKLGPGKTVTGVIPFTPRVTGAWAVEASFSVENSRYGVGGGQLTVPSPVRVKLDHESNPAYLRIGEPLRVDVTIETTETLQDARFGIASMVMAYFRQGESLGEVRPGLAHELAKSTSAGSNNLGTLRPGGLVNTSFEVVAKASGRYAVTPYVIAGGFAYTNPPLDDSQPGREMVYMPGMSQHGAAVLNLAVQPRHVENAWAIAPLAVGMALFVGTWTLRTRFVK